MKITFNKKIKSTALDKEIKALQRARKTKYESVYASINLSDDKETRLKCSKLAMKHKSATMLIVVGIGGSNLGTMAIQEAVQGKLHNETKLPKVYYADTVDSNSILDILHIMEHELKGKGNVAINVISKSGGTTETIANFEILVEALKKKRKDYREWVTVTTSKGSKFDKFAKKEGYSRLYIPEKVGGRYSVFSPVGLYPLALMGLDITGLTKGANEMVKHCTQEFNKNPAAQSAVEIFEKSKKGINIIDHFFFSTNLESVGKWYRQLMGESIGKEHNKRGKIINAGLTPTVSIGSTDLHSMAQLYLGGPKDKFTIFVTADPSHTHSVPRLKRYAKLIPVIQGKKLTKLMDAIFKGTISAFKKDKREYCHIHLKDHKAYSIGQFLQFKMIEMMFLGALLNVNPFDQPAVEKYKIETKKVLRR